MTTQILVESPLDRPEDSETASGAVAREPVVWKPSRFNVQVTTREGWLLLWNTLTGSVNAFRPAQRRAVRHLISRRGVEATEHRLAGYLAKRGYLVPRGTDELRKVRHLAGEQHYRNDILELILLASEDCNFRCTYCYEDFRRGTMRPGVRMAVKRLVESRLNVLRTLRIMWFGGEPLYGMRAIEDLAPFFVDTAEHEGLDFSSHMTTNGFLLSEDVVSRLLSWRITDFQVTLDGTAADHDVHRAARDGSGTFQTIFDNLAAMSARGDKFSVTIRVNYDRGNVERLESFLALVQETFRNDSRFCVALYPVGRWGGANDENLDVCGVDEQEIVRAKLHAAAQTLGLQIAGDQLPEGRFGTEVCYAARPYNLVVGAAGDLMKCTVDLDKKEHNIVGKLRPDGTLDLDLDKMALWTELAFERDSGCQSCHMLAACQGIHCPKIRIDHGRRPCPDTRRLGKQRLVEFFNSKRDPR